MDSQPSEVTRRRCGYCGELMVNRVSNRAQYCSRKCQEKAANQRRQAVKNQAKAGRTCLQCGTEIPITVTALAKFCSQQCGRKWNNRKTKEKLKAARRERQGPCAQCGGRIPATVRAGAAYCSPECRKRARAARWREQAPHYMRQYMYGITQDEFNAMLASQGGVCAICGTSDWPGKDHRPHVDHDHVTKRFRGILCGSCNQGLHRFGDDPALLRAAADYLREAAKRLI